MFLELPFKAADVPHLGQVWETAGVTLAAGERKDDEVPNCYTVSQWSWNTQPAKTQLEEKIPNNQYLTSASTASCPPSSRLKIGVEQLGLPSGACLLREEVKVHAIG